MSALAREQPAFVEQQKRVAAANGTIELRRYVGDDGGSFAVVFMRIGGVKDAAGTAVRAFEDGAHSSSAKVAHDVSYRAFEDGVLFVGEQVISVDGHERYMKRLTGVKDGRFQSLSGICEGTQSTCKTALMSLAIDRTGFAPLVTTRRGSDAYEIGQATGRLLMAVLIILVLIWVLVRMRRARLDSSRPQ